MLEKLGISTFELLVSLVVLYYVIKWAVKNGINESELNQNSKQLQSTADELKNSYEEIQRSKEMILNNNK